MRISDDSLLDRDRELAAAAVALVQTESGVGRTVLIEGSAGVGKSALLAAIAEEARGRGFEILLGRAGQYEGDLPWGVVADLFGPLIEDLGEVERQALFSGAASLAAPTFGLTSEGAPTPNSLAASLHGLYWLTVGVADRYGKILLAFDDIHWADEPSMRWLERVAKRVDELPVLIVATIRTDDPAAKVAAERLRMTAPGLTTRLSRR